MTYQCREGIKINTELYKKFEQSNLPCEYSFKDIERILKEKYSAIEYGMDIYREQEPVLYEEELAKNELPFKCFKIEDESVLDNLYNESVLDNLYNEEEKLSHKNQIEGYSEEETNPEIEMWLEKLRTKDKREEEKLSGKYEIKGYTFDFLMTDAEIEKSLNELDPENDESPADIMWRKVQTGQLINILLYGSEQEGLTGFTIQGDCNKIIFDMRVLKGIDPKNCVPGNSEFDAYIELLEKMGYI